MSTEKEDRTARRQAVMWLMRNIDAIDLVSTRIGIDRNRRHDRASERYPCAVDRRASA